MANPSHIFVILSNIFFILISGQIIIYREEDFGGITNVQARSNFTSHEVERPLFCGDTECPPFKMICTRDKIEVRTYGPTVWAYSDVTAKNKLKAINIASKNVGAYFSGQNSQNLKITMSAPVLIKELGVKPNFATYFRVVNKWFSDKTYRVLYYIPKKYVDDLPLPNNRDVNILKEGNKSYFSYFYPGYVWALYYNNKYQILKTALMLMGAKDIPSEFYVASYDNITKFLDRRNEIWIEASASDVAKICNEQSVLK
ncbi:unnamed protein product [Gordionus sp. m RMFG-2023]